MTKSSSPRLGPTTWCKPGVGIFGELAEGLRYQLYFVNGFIANGFTAESAIREGHQEAQLGTVTRLPLRFAPQDTTQAGPYSGFAFDPTQGRYVWHCHILEHEDNGMMRPYQITN